VSWVLKEVVDELSPMIEEALRRFLRKEGERAEKFSGLLREYYGSLEEFLLRGGKRLRPIALVVAYEGVGGQDVEAAVEASICVELLHNSSLVHDDIIDRDELRRGGPTMHVKYRDWLRKLRGERDAEHFGLSMGILAGDSLFNLGFKSLAEARFREEVKLKALKLYVEAYEQLVEGVIIDTCLPLALEVGEDDYLAMVDLKTGSLFEKSLTIGSTLAEARPSQLRALSRYGILAARGFQIQDDIIGLFGREEEVGKPVGSDVREGKMTLLMVKALQLASLSERERLRSLLGKRDLTVGELAEVRRIVEGSGALEHARGLAASFIEGAKQQLRLADPPLTVKALSFFEELADFFIQRSF
jgi:geranylgeranyl diphosphate synthase type I